MNKIGTALWLLFALGINAQSVTEQEASELVVKLQNTIEEEYVLTENINKITRALTHLKQSNELSSIESKKDLAKLLSTTIKAFDGHFGVMWDDPARDQSDQPERESWFTKLSRKNSGFNKLEVLEGNIGYIDFWGFDNVYPASKRKVEAAMTFLADTDAMIFDLRNNGGGSAEMIRLISSYFLQGKVHLNSFYSRQTGETIDFWSYKQVKGKKRPKVPLYILTSKKTFSAAEEFSYNFKHLNRATIIGQPTGGGANPVYYFDLGNGFRASIPVSKAVNPITKTNWEGVGVQPHIRVDTELALDTAYKLALESISKNSENKFQQKEIKEQQQKLGEKLSK